MNIEKALSHFKWKFENGWKPTARDIEAFNSILEWKELQEQQTLSDNESLAKLWIHQLMLLNSSNMYSAERAIEVIDEILSKSVYQWCECLHAQIPMMNVNNILNNEDYKQALRHGNITKANEILSNLIKENEKEITDAIRKKPTIDKIVKFVETQINRVINKFEK